MNRGAEQLRRLLLRRGDQQRMSVELGVTPGAFSCWANGKRRPGTAARVQLQERYGIDWQTWDEPVSPPEAA